MNELSVSASESNQELAEAFSRYLEARGLSRNTVVSYRRSIGDFLEMLGPVDCRMASPATIRGFFTDRIEMGRSQASVHVYNCAIRGFYKFLRLASAIRNLPKIGVMQQVKSLPHVLTESQIDTLIGAATSLRDRALLELLYATGLRISEAANLCLSDIHWSEGMVLVRNGKGGRDRVVPFGGKAEAALKQYLADYPHESDYVFERVTGKGSVVLRGKTWWGRFSSDKKQHYLRIGTVAEFPTHESAAQELQRRLKTLRNYEPRPAGRMSVRQLGNIVVGISHRVGLKVFPHLLRHSSASHFLSHCHDIRVVQEFLGHSSVSTTMVYTHVGIDDLKSTHARCHPHESEASHEKKASSNG